MWGETQGTVQASGINVNAVFGDIGMNWNCEQSLLLSGGGD